MLQLGPFFIKRGILKSASGIFLKKGVFLVNCLSAFRVPNTNDLRLFDTFCLFWKPICNHSGKNQSEFHKTKLTNEQLDKVSQTLHCGFQNHGC